MSAMYRNSIALAVIVSVMMLPGASAAETDRQRTITLVGRAEVHVSPDLAYVTVGVASEAKTASDALRTNNVALSKVVEAIKSAGVQSQDIQTSGFSLQPRYFTPRNPTESDQPRIVGYTASNNVSIRVRDLAKLGALLDKVVTVGANQIRGIHFDVSDRERLVDDARRKAVADARRKAELYASAAGIRLGNIVRITEAGTPAVRPMARFDLRAAPAQAVPIETGELSLGAQVEITWSLAD
jgi:uncharacterized protein YggE